MLGPEKYESNHAQRLSCAFVVVAVSNVEGRCTRGCFRLHGCGSLANSGARIPEATDTLGLLKLAIVPWGGIELEKRF